MQASISLPDRTGDLAKRILEPYGATIGGYAATLVDAMVRMRAEDRERIQQEMKHALMKADPIPELAGVGPVKPRRRRSIGKRPC